MGRRLYTVSCFRTLGDAASPMNIMSILNPAGSGKGIVIPRWNVFEDQSVLQGVVAHRFYRTADPAAGTVLVENDMDTANAAAAFVARGATASDGGAATAITATLGTLVATWMTNRNTGAGVGMDPLRELQPFLLRAGEGVVWQVAGSAAAATTHFTATATVLEIDL